LFIFEAAGQHDRADVRTPNISRQVRRRPRDAIRLAQPTVGQGVEI
jgi:NADH-quinone oxidoreductase subunit J